MTQQYPVVSEKPLDPPVKRGPLGMGRARRNPDDLPRAQGNQVRVYLVDGKHVVDDGNHYLDDDLVVRARHVSVVDLTRNQQIDVELPIPSADAEEFAVRVTFLCSVTDAVAVVRNGQKDAVQALLGYVRSHHRLFQLGLDHLISAVNIVRLLVQTQIEAYVQLKPPLIPGLTISLASVEVLTPKELITFHGRLRAQGQEHEIASDRAKLDSDLAQANAAHRQELDLQSKKYELQLDQMRQLIEQQQQLFQQTIIAKDNAFSTEQVAMLREAYGNDPLNPAIAAVAKGELTTTDIAARMQQEKERLDAAAQAEQERVHALEQADRDYYRAAGDRRDELDEEERKRIFQARYELLKRLSEQGHFDDVYVELERLLGNLDIPKNEKAAVENGDGGRDALEPGAAHNTGPEDTGSDDEDTSLREEDA